MTSGYFDLSINNISTFVFNLNNNPTNCVQECELEELVKHGLRALRDTLPNEVVTILQKYCKSATAKPIAIKLQVDLTNKNVSIAIVGKDHPFTVYDDAGVDPYLAGIEGEERR